MISKTTDQSQPPTPRQIIVTYIRKHPGTHFEAIKTALHMKNGTFAYHIKVLEREGEIFSRHVGRKTLFFHHTRRASGVKYTPLQQRVLDIIRHNPGICQSEIRRKLRIKQQTLNYNVKKLASLGVIELVRQGRKKAIHIVDDKSA